MNTPPWGWRQAALVIVGVASISTARAGRLQRKPAPWLVERHVRTPDGPRRLALVTEMARRRDPALIGVLVAAADDPDRAVRLVALDGLARFGGALADPGRDRAYLAALHAGEAGALPTLASALQDRLLHAEEPGMDALISGIRRAAVQSSAWRTRKAAVELLARWPSPASGTTVAERAARDQHPEVRRAAATALGELDVPDGRAVLAQLRRTDTDAQVRMAAERALARLGGPESDRVIAVLPFQTDDPRLARAAAELQTTLTSQLELAGVARVVERGQLDAVFSELRLHDALAAEGEAVELGQLLRADTVVTGTLLRHGDEVQCLSKRIDVQTGRVQAAPVAIGGLHDLAALQRTCARRLVDSL